MPSLFFLALTDMSSWEVDIGSGKQSVFVYLTSSVPATFSSQFCVLNETGCSPVGPEHTLRVVGIFWERGGECGFNVNVSKSVTSLIHFTGGGSCRDQDGAASSPCCAAAVRPGKVHAATLTGWKTTKLYHHVQNQLSYSCFAWFSCRCGSRVLLFTEEEFSAQTVSLLKMFTHTDTHTSPNVLTYVPLCMTSFTICMCAHTLLLLSK